MDHYYHNIGENWFTYPSLYKDMVERFDDCKFLELGCWKGRSASFMGVEIINSGKNIVLYCVDSWKGSDDHQDIKSIDFDQVFDEFMTNICPVKDVVWVRHMESTRASTTFADEEFSFIFIDACHQYEEVKKDLQLWYPKVKSGGIFAGHDYGTWDGVTKAVDEFVKNNSLKVSINNSEFTWKIEKP